MTSPSVQHLQAAKEVLRYLKGTQNKGILYGGHNEDLNLYADASYATAEDRKSI